MKYCCHRVEAGDMHKPYRNENKNTMKILWQQKKAAKRKKTTKIPLPWRCWRAGLVCFFIQFLCKQKNTKRKTKTQKENQKNMQENAWCRNVCAVRKTSINLPSWLWMKEIHQRLARAERVECFNPTLSELYGLGTLFKAGLTFPASLTSFSFSFFDKFSENSLWRRKPGVKTQTITETEEPFSALRISLCTKEWKE